MDTQKSTQVENQRSLTAVPIDQYSCRTGTKKADATFFEDLKDHFDEFKNRSMEDHKNCFYKKMEKMFGMSKIVAERNGDPKDVDNSLPTQTKVSS